MAFTVDKEIGEVRNGAASRYVKVQIVTLTNQLTGEPVRRVEARVFVDSDKYSGATKESVALYTPEQIDEMIALLEEAKAAFIKKNGATTKPATSGNVRPKQRTSR